MPLIYMDSNPGETLFVRTMCKVLYPQICWGVRRTYPFASTPSTPFLPLPEAAASRSAWHLGVLLFGL